MSKNLRAFSTFSRALFRPRPSSPLYDGPITVQRVRIVRPFFSIRRMHPATIAFIGLGTYLYFADEDDEGVKGKATSTEKLETAHTKNESVEIGEEREIQEVDENEVVIPDEPPPGAWFIPLGWAHENPKTYYKGTDPEWQSFVEFSKDKTRSMNIRNELAGITGNFLTLVPAFQKFLGQPIVTGKYWLDIDFPEGPPPEYERAGLEITDDYIAWTVRKVDPMNIARLRNALWPMPTVSSFSASTTAFWQLQIAKVKNYLGIKSNGDSEKPRLPPGYMNLARLVQTRDGETAAQTEVEKALTNQAKQPELPSPSPSMSPGSDRHWILRGLPGIPRPSPEMETATTVFKHTLKKNLKPASIATPRGTFLVSGLVEVSGPKGVCVLDVRAAYHPIESRWVAIGTGIRRIQPRKQGPRGH